MSDPATAPPRARRRWPIVLVVSGLVLVLASVWFCQRLSALRALRATGPSWSFPSRIYSDGLAFVEGRALAVPYLLDHLEARGYREVRGPALSPGTFSRSGVRFEIALRTSSALDVGGARFGDANALPRVRLTIDRGRLVSVERLGGTRAPKRGRGRDDDRHDAEAAGPPGLEPVPIALMTDDDRIWRVWTPLARVPVGVRDAIVASEDRRFERHVGIDLRAYWRALFANMRAGQVREGGSTITQQLARALFLGRDRNLFRKLAEVPLALGLELALSKPQILEMYLNSVYWGQAGGTSIGGIEAASRWYFDAPVEALGVLEGATLAAIIPAPNVYDPFERPRLVRARRDKVLRDMVASKRLDAETGAKLMRQPLRVRRGSTPEEPHPSYSGFVRDQLTRRTPAERVAQRGWIVITSMDLVWQRQAESGLQGAVEALDPGWAPLENGRRPVLEGAFVALEPGTGAVRAMVGGRQPRVGAFNRAYQARRQTGSAIKPVVYAAALATGVFTPASTLSDQPRTYATDRGPWTPRNDDGSSHDKVTLVKALERSLNVATTHLVETIGPAYVARVAERFGLGKLKPVMSIGLGSNEATLIDLTRAFAVFGDGGVLHPASAVRRIVDGAGHEVAMGSERSSRAIPEPIATLMTGLLNDVVRFGVAYPLRSLYGFTRPAAGKTGTTDDYKDAWFVGFTPDLVAGVWIGYDRPRNMARLASKTALPAWAWIVGPMLEGFAPTPFASDARLEWRNVDPWSGKLAQAGCESQPVPFLPGTTPTTYCDPTLPWGPQLEELDPDSLGAEPARPDSTE